MQASVFGYGASHQNAKSYGTKEKSSSHVQCPIESSLSKLDESAGPNDEAPLRTTPIGNAGESRGW